MKPPALRRLLGDLPPVALPDENDEAFRRLERALASPPRSSRVRPLLWLVPLGATAAAGLLVFGGSLGGSLTKAPKKRCPEGTKCLENFAAQAEPAPVPEPALRPLPVRLQDHAANEHDERIALADGSLALLERGSRVIVGEQSPAEIRLDLEQGALFVHAAHHATGSLRVEAGDCSVIVHGTGFRVERRDRELRVGLWHGSVEVRRWTGESLFLRPGQELRHPEGAGLDQATVGPLSEAARGRAEEAELLGLPPAPAPAHATSQRPVALPSVAPPVMPAVTPEAHADVARCLTRTGANPTAAELKLDLTLADDGQVLSAAAEPGEGDPRLASCVAEAALHWTLGAPPTALRGLQFVYPIPLK
ncbi:MAG: FecR domain-containing protein [Deltaproteobacteria bacterium]